MAANPRAACSSCHQRVPVRPDGTAHLHGTAGVTCPGTGKATGPTATDAYNKGWDAAGRGFDMDAAEARYLRRYGHEHAAAWVAGWSDRAAGAERGATRPK